MRVKHILILFFVVYLSSCNDMNDIKNPAELPDTGNDYGRLYVLSEGLFNHNNSTLACIDYDANTFYYDFFKQVGKNKRDIGDTANDMKLYNNQLWIVVTVSSLVEVVDVYTGVSIKQIHLSYEGGGYQPRNIAFYRNKAYVCSFDGTVVRINTSNFEIEAIAECGRNPDGIAVVNNKLYVSNSGGLDAVGVPGLSYDNTVSVIDIDTFREIKKIETGINPHKLDVDSRGNIYVIARGNLGSIKPSLHIIDSGTDIQTHTFDNLEVSNFCLRNDTAFLYTYDRASGGKTIQTFDCAKKEIISDHFIKGNIDIQLPYAIYAHPVNGNIFISDAKDYTRRGDVYCFDGKGNFRYKIEEVGMNPNSFIFIEM